MRWLEAGEWTQLEALVHVRDGFIRLRNPLQDFSHKRDAPRLCSMTVRCRQSGGALATAAEALVGLLGSLPKPELLSPGLRSGVPLALLVLDRARQLLQRVSPGALHSVWTTAPPPAGARAEKQPLDLVLTSLRTWLMQMWDVPAPDASVAAQLRTRSTGSPLSLLLLCRTLLKVDAPLPPSADAAANAFVAGFGAAVKTASAAVLQARRPPEETLAAQQVTCPLLS